MTSQSTTPSGARIWAEAPDGSRIDVTEAIQVLYDTLLSSMDWGSGFLSHEEVIPVAELAEACGFDNEAPRAYLKSLTRYFKGVRYHEPDVKQAQAAQAWLDSHPEPQPKEAPDG